MKSSLYVKKQETSKALLWKNSMPVLGSLDIELTERCNNNCIHCCINLPEGDLNAKDKELSTSQIKNILKEAVSLDCLTVRFTGGEPLLRDDFEELYVFARKLGLKVLLFTNATLITSKLADLLSHIPPLEKVEVTVYGMRKASYEGVTRVSGSFEAAWRGINLLLEKKTPFIVKSSLLPPNKDEIDEFEKWAKNIPWIGKSPPYSMFFNLRRRYDSRKNESIKKLRVTPEQGLRVLTRQKNRYLNNMKEFCSKFMRPSGDRLFSCGAGRASGCVDAYGMFQPCMLLRQKETVYDLKKGSLKDALINFFPKVREIKAINPDYLNRCAKCFLKGLCAQCPAKSCLESGTLDTPVEYYCEIAHAQARFLGLIKEGEMAWEIKDGKDRIRKFTK